MKAEMRMSGGITSLEEQRLVCAALRDILTCPSFNASHAFICKFKVNKQPLLCTIYIAGYFKRNVIKAPMIIGLSIDTHENCNSPNLQ